VDNRYYEALAASHFSSDLESDDDLSSVFFKDTQHRYQYINDNGFSIMQYYVGDALTRESVIGKKDTDIYPPDTAKFFMDFDKKVMESQKTESLFQIYTISKSKIIYSTAVKVPIKNENGEVIGLLGRTRYLNYFKIDGRPIILSKRELDIFAHTVFGIPIKQTANNLDLSVGTVSSYLGRLKVKLNYTSQNQIIKLIRRHVLSTHVLEYLCMLTEK